MTNWLSAEWHQKSCIKARYVQLLYTVGLYHRSKVCDSM